MSISAKLLADKIKCEQSLHEFVLQAWPQIEGNKPFIDGWAIQIICEHLEAAFYGNIKKLLLNIPPRMGKTNLISVMLPAWGFIHIPSIKFLYASYAMKISLEHSRLCRMLIESEWYQKRWGDRVRLSKDQATKGHFVTTAFGHRMATSVGAGSTATGGDFLVMDDPNDAKDGESNVKRDSANDWVSRVWSSRLNPGAFQVQILVQQRVDELDVSGYLMKQEKDWVKLILPMEYEESRKCRTIVLPSTNGKVWEDPRRKEGELLCPNYLTKEDVMQKHISLGRFNYAGQYQQRPSPQEGGLVRKGDFRIWTAEKLPVIRYMVQSWDTALTDKQQSDYSVCSTWGIFVDANKVNNLILLYVWKDKVTYPELLKRAVRLQKNCADIYKRELEADKYNQPDVILIEDKAAGNPLMDDLVAKGIAVRGFNPGKYGDKFLRLNLCSSYIENGKIWVIGDENKEIIKDQTILVDDCVVFPNGESDDAVDTMTQCILFLSKEKGLLKHSMDFKIERETFPKEQMPGYKEPKQKRVDFKV
jgi:predicted phage terminase large subunit-like protein